MEKQIYISDEERIKCQKLADAFAKLYEMENIAVLDVGRNDFVKLQSYSQTDGFENVAIFRAVRVCLRIYGRNGLIQSYI